MNDTNERRPFSDRASARTMRSIPIQYGRDYEAAHDAADELLAEVLLSLGYTELVAEYRKVGKWYA